MYLTIERISDNHVTLLRALFSLFTIPSLSAPPSLHYSAASSRNFIALDWFNLRSSNGRTPNMRNRFISIALAVLALGFAFVPRSNAGTDMIIDNSAQAPPPVYHYAPPPLPVYYAPPPVSVVVYPTYPTYAYYARPVRVFGYQRFHGHGGSWHHGHSHGH
jgi:hypothetical protein